MTTLEALKEEYRLLTVNVSYYSKRENKSQAEINMLQKARAYRFELRKIAIDILGYRFEDLTDGIDDEW